MFPGYDNNADVYKYMGTWTAHSFHGYTKSSYWKTLLVQSRIIRYMLSGN